MLCQVAEWICENPKVQILVEGHCAQHPDQLESYVRADNLSRTRAENVASFLHLRGASFSQMLRPAAKGTTTPISQNEDDAGRHCNRRVDVIVVVDQRGQLVPVSTPKFAETHPKAPELRGSPAKHVLDQIQGRSEEGRRRALQVPCLQCYSLQFLSAIHCSFSVLFIAVSQCYSLQFLGAIHCSFRELDATPVSSQSARSVCSSL